MFDNSFLSFFFFIQILGNRWKGVASSKFRYDDEIHGHEIGSCIENLQYCEPNCTTEALVAFLKWHVFITFPIEKLTATHTHITIFYKKNT